MTDTIEDELRQFLFSSFPCVPFTAKKNAKALFDQVILFGPDSNRQWIDSLPKVVQTAFVLFFTRKQLDGIQFKSFEQLKDESIPLVQRIKEFLDKNARSDGDSNVGNKDVTQTGESEEKPESAKRLKPTTDEQLEQAAASKRNSIMVVLVGLPGSGKSTLCELLKRNVSVGSQTIRLCQDEIGKEKCEIGAHAAMKEGGKFVLIDRTNYNKVQRSTWVAVAKRYKSKVIAVNLDVAKDVCVERARSRKDHSLQPGKVPMVVGLLANSYKIATKDEGFDAVFSSNSPNASNDLQTPILDFVRSAWNVV